MELTRERFLIMTLLAHAGFVGLLFLGGMTEWLLAFTLFCALTITSTTFYHRLLSHQAWKPARWLSVLGVGFGVFSLTGTPVTRTAVHRAHHAFSDTEKDPHSPLHSSFLHMYLPQLKEDVHVSIRRAADVIQDPVFSWLHRQYVSLNLGLLLLLLLVYPMGALIWLAAAAMVWANIACCNILCHGQNGIRDNCVLGFLTFGEGHHKHHHDAATSARFGSCDPGWWFIRTMQWLRLAS